MMDLGDKIALDIANATGDKTSQEFIKSFAEDKEKAVNFFKEIDMENKPAPTLDTVSIEKQSQSRFLLV